jgi:hypothetical protein
VHSLDRLAGAALDETVFAGAAFLAVHVGGAKPRRCGIGTCYDDAGFFVPPGNGAITFGSHAFCSGACSAETRHHEAVHMEQWHDTGASFAVRYLYQLAVNGQRCDNPWERPAYATSGRC